MTFPFFLAKNVNNKLMLSQRQVMDVLNLPIPIVCEILSKYLFPNEVGIFDTSICNASSRQKLLDEIYVDKSFYFWTDEMAMKRVSVPSFNYSTKRLCSFLSFSLWLWKREVIIRKWKFNDFRNMRRYAVSSIWNKISPRVLSEMQHFNFANYSNMDDADLQQVTESCPNITFLNLCSCSNITSDGIRFIARLKSLVGLNVSVCNFGPRDLMFVAEHCLKLKYLWWDIGNGANVNENSVVHTDHTTSDSLLGLVDVLGDTNTDLILISFQCQEFKEDFSISLYAINKIVSSFPFLIVLLLNGTVNFGDDGARVIARGCPNLKVIGLSKDFGRITDMGAIVIGQGCPDLIEINFGGHLGITSCSINVISLACKNLKRVYLRGTSVSNEVVTALPGILLLFGTLSGVLLPAYYYPSGENRSEEFFEEDYRQKI